MQKNNFSMTETAKELGVTQGAISQAVARYGIREEYAKIAEELGFGNKEAIKELIDHHIKKEKDREALIYHLKQLNHETREEGHTTVNTKNINIIMSEAYKQAKERYATQELRGTSDKGKSDIVEPDAT